MDNIMIVQEVMHSSLERNEQGITIKLDKENVFNRGNLSLLAIVLKNLASLRKL